MKFKKSLALVLAVIMTFSLCSCRKMTVERLTAGMVKALLNEESFSGTMNTEMDINLNIFKQELDISTKLDADIEYSGNTAHAEGNFYVDLADKNMLNTPVENYTVIEEGSVTNYALSQGTWYKAGSELPSVNTGSFSLKTIKTLLDSENLGNIALQENTESFNGKEVYVLTIENCAYTELALDAVLSQFEYTLGNIDFSDIDLSGIQMNVTLKVYKDTKLPAQLIIDYGDSITSVTGSAMDAISEEISSYFGSVASDMFSFIFKGFDFELEVPNTKITIVFEEYGISVAPIPQDALNGADASEYKPPSLFDSLFKGGF